MHRAARGRRRGRGAHPVRGAREDVRLLPRRPPRRRPDRGVLQGAAGRPGGPRRDGSRTILPARLPGSVRLDLAEARPAHSRLGGGLGVRRRQLPTGRAEAVGCRRGRGNSSLGRYSPKPVEAVLRCSHPTLRVGWGQATLWAVSMTMRSDPYAVSDGVRWDVLPPTLYELTTPR